MQPHSLSKVRLVTDRRTPEERFAALGPIAKRFGRFEKGTILPTTHVQACPRVKVGSLPPGFLKQNHVESLEHNQKISSCCRHPENHEVEAFKSHPEELAPDIYIFHCTCGRKHRMFCIGASDERPVWGAG